MVQGQRLLRDQLCTQGEEIKKWQLAVKTMKLKEERRSLYGSNTPLSVSSPSLSVQEENIEPEIMSLSKGLENTKTINNESPTKPEKNNGNNVITSRRRIAQYAKTSNLDTTTDSKQECTQQ